MENSTKEQLLKELKLLRRDANEDQEKATVREAIDVLIRTCEFLLEERV
jgi:hypothetical protein